MLKNVKKCLTKFLKCAKIFLDARKGASIWKGRTNKKYILKGV